MGKDYVVIETVGVGQDEVEVARAAHTTVVVAVPGLGDDIQAIKAGIMEIADLFVINKADREGADRTVMEIEMMLRLGGEDEESGWVPPVLKAVAGQGEGIVEVTEAVLSHQAFLQTEDRGREKRRDRSQWIFWSLLQDRLTAKLLERLGNGGRVERVVDRIAARETDPHTAVEDILREAGL
jgi:LAO/AO transport system kinase